MAAIAIAMCVLALACALRFTTRLNDVLSGCPAYMRGLSHELVRNLLESGYGSVPLFVIRDEDEKCRAIPLTRNYNEDAMAMVVSYSESRHSFCLITYAGRVSTDQDRVASVLPPPKSESFGAELDGPVKGVTVAYYLKAFPDEMIRLIDWHQPWPSGQGVISAGTRNEGRSAAPAGMVSNGTFTMNLFRVRDEVARRHNRVNLALDWIFLVFGAVGVVAGWWLRGSYVELRDYRATCGLPLTAALFLSTNATHLAREGAERRRQIEEELEAAERATQLRQRRREEARARLQFLLDNTPEQDENTRRQVQVCLREDNEKDSLEKMEQLADQLMAARGQRTPQVRLQELLVSLRELCSEDELQDYRRQALLLLEREGFRAAREMLVQTHAQLRERARKDLENETVEDEHPTGADAQ